MDLIINIVQTIKNIFIHFDINDLKNTEIF
jgi:hypothetical protein